MNIIYNVIEKYGELKMEKIASFTVNHTNLLPGVYLSRRDRDPNSETYVSTFDLRFTAPNREPAMDTPAIHTIEHLGATYLRNCAYKDKIIYFGPMGCRTGFYLVVFGMVEPLEIIPVIKEMCEFILKFDGEIPGAHSEECGNYQEQNLSMAKYYINKFYNELITYNRTKYPA